MRKILAVYDVDPFYTDRFVEYLARRERIPFEAVAFTTLERLKAYLKEHRVELLLLGEESAAQQLQSYSVGQIVLLSEVETVLAGEAYPSVYKFQSSAAVIREVMSYYTARSDNGDRTARKAQIYGVYSPISRCLKTSLALAMGQLLARQLPVLYVSLEQYSGLGELLGETYETDLSDVLYLYEQDKDVGKGICLDNAVRSVGGLVYIPPVRSPEDLDALTGAELAGFLKYLSDQGDYQLIVLDVGNGIGNPIPILEQCSAIYMPVKEDAVSMAKVDAFDAHLAYLGKAELQARVKKLKLPFHMNFGRKENYVDQLIWGELGDYVRNLLRGPLWTNEKRY